MVAIFATRTVCCSVFFGLHRYVRTLAQGPLASALLAVAEGRESWNLAPEAVDHFRPVVRMYQSRSLQKLSRSGAAVSIGWHGP